MTADLRSSVSFKSLQNVRIVNAEDVAKPRPRTVLPPNRTPVSAPLALVLVTQLAACQAMQTTDAPEPPLRNAVSLIRTSGGGAQVPLKVAPGLISVEVEVTWSNGAQDKTPLGLDAPLGSDLLVLAYERSHGVRPATIKLSRPAPSRASSSLWADALTYCGYCFAAVILTAPLWLSIRALANRPGIRPSPDCCFVWVEDTNTGEIVAGNSPWRQIAIPANTARTEPEVPSDTGEDLVNCMSGGMRKWVYQSRCD